MEMILLLSLLAMVAVSSSAFTTLHQYIYSLSSPSYRIIQHKPLFSSWDNFGYDDEDELLEVGPDEGFVAADENDDPAVKAAAGMALEAPEVCVA